MEARGEAVSEPTSPTLTYTEAKEIVKAWRKDFRLGVGDEYVIKAFLDTEAELKTLRAQLTAGIRTLDTSRFLHDRIICLIGTSGVGKTSTAAKLAARAKKLWNRKVTWICADTIRAGAIAQASALTESLSIPLRVVYTPEELRETIAAEQDSDLLLVDTSATNPRRDTDMIELASFLTAVPGMAM